MTLKQKLLERMVKLIDPKWIVGIGNDNKGELGIRVAGMNFWYYKWPEPMLVSSKEYPYKIADKREFGETIKSVL